MGLLTQIGQAVDPLTVTPIDSGSHLGSIAIIISLLISGFGIYRGWKSDKRAAKKEEVQTIIENYRILLKESRARETKLEDIVSRQNKIIEANEAIIEEQKQAIRTIKKERDDYRDELIKLNALPAHA